MSTVPPEEPSLESRVDRLLRRDRLLALAFTVAMWLTLVFVFLEALATAGSLDIVVVLGVAMVALGGLNTASTVALVRRYRAARDAVYLPDIAHLDRRRALEAEQRARS